MTGLKDTDKNKEWQFAALLLSGASLAISNGLADRPTDLCGIMQMLDLMQLWMHQEQNSLQNGRMGSELSTCI